MNGFTFFENYYKAINDPEVGLTEEEQGRLYNAIFSYMFEDKELELKGACKMAFQLVKPSLDLSKIRSNARRKNQNSEEENQNEIKTEQNEIKSDFSPFFEKEKKKEEKEIITDGLNACAREEGEEADEMVVTYLKFQREHPDVIADITNPSLIATVDWELLGKKIAESRFLQTRKSLSWLIGNYHKITSDAYKDFRGKSPPQKGDSQIEFLKNLYAEYAEEDERNAEKNGSKAYNGN